MSINVNSLDEIIYVITDGDTVFVSTQRGNPSQSAIQFQDEGVNLGSKGSVETVNFTGSGVSATRSGNSLTVNITGGGGGGTGDISGSGTTNEIAYFTATKTIASLPVASYPNLTELSYIKGLRAKPGLTILHKTNASNALALSGTSEGKVYSFLIPANTFEANDIVEIEFLFQKSGAISNATYRCRVGTADDLTGTIISTFTTGAGGQVASQIRRIMTFKNSLSSQDIFSTSTSSAGDIGSSTSAPTALTIDFSQAQYMVFSAAENGSTVTLRWVKVTILRS